MSRISGGESIASVAHRRMFGKRGVLIEKYASDAVVRTIGGEQQGGGTFGGCQGLTRGVLKRMWFMVCNAVGKWLSVVTLTYPGEWPRDGRVVKGHLHEFLDGLRYIWPDLKYAWFMEWQQRGAPHFHVLLDVLPDREMVSRRWYAIVGSGDERHLRAGTQVKGARAQGGLVGYFMKLGYLAKSRSKQVPPGFINPGRLSGTSRGLVVVCDQDLVTEEQGVLIVRQLRKSAERPTAKRGRRRMAHKDKGFRGFTGFGKQGIIDELVAWARQERPGEVAG